MVWYGAGIRKLGDGDGMVTGGGTEIKVSIPFHPIPIPFRWDYHPNILPRIALPILEPRLSYVNSANDLFRSNCKFILHCTLM